MGRKLLTRFHHAPFQRLDFGAPSARLAPGLSDPRSSGLNVMRTIT
jgi:hypothetical protein